MAHLWPVNQNHCRWIHLHLGNINHSLKNTMFLKWKQPATCKSRSLVNTMRIAEKFITNDASRQSTKSQHHLPRSTGCHTAASPKAASSLLLEHCCSSSNVINQTRKPIHSVETKTKTKNPTKSCKKITLPLLLLAYFSSWISFLT